MTIKANTGSVSLSLQEIQAEFGGSDPINLSEYYAGGTYVNSGTLGYPVNGGSAVAIPSSGAISVRNFFGASAEPSTVDIANYFWDNRAKLIRYSHAPQSLTASSYPNIDGGIGGATGIDQGLYPNTPNYDFFWANNFNNRGRGNFTNTFSYNNSSLPITSSYFTVISAQAGHIGTSVGSGGPHGVVDATCDGGTLFDNTIGTRTYVGDGTQPESGDGLFGDGFGVSWNTKIYQGSVANITTSSVTGQHYADKYGSWLYCWIIPGKWTWSGTVNFDPLTFSTTLASGEMMLVLAERGGNYRQQIPPPNYGTTDVGILKSATIDQWWYNGADAQITVNTTTSSKTFTYRYYQPESTGYDYNGSYTIPAQWTTNFPGGWTPRVALKLTRFY